MPMLTAALFQKVTIDGWMGKWNVVLWSECLCSAMAPTH